MPKDSLLNINKMYKLDFDLLRQASQVSLISLTPFGGLCTF